MSAELRCRGVVASPGETPVLRGIDLDVPAGTLTALAGPSGAGKTTLLRAIAGLQELGGGAIELGGRRIDTLPAHRRGIAVVFQEPRLLPHLDAADNVALPLRAAGVRAAERRRRADELLEQVGLSGLASRAARGLSGGEQQRVALARALVGEPELLLLDEPLAALDPNRRDSLRRLITRIQSERELTTLLVTHDRSEAAELGSAIALVLEGRIVQHGPPRELFERPRTAAIARFFGAANLLRGTVSAGAIDIGGQRLEVGGADGPAAFVARPETIRLDESGPLRAVVGAAIYSGTHVRLTLELGDRTLEAHVLAGTSVAVGEEVTFAFADGSPWRLASAQDEDGEAQPLADREHHHRGEHPGDEVGA